MTFPGFPNRKTPLTPVPEPFFTELLPQIDHLGELKVTVYAFWRLGHKEGAFRCLRGADFLEDPRFMAGLGGQAALDEALQRAVQRGTFLTAASNGEVFYFLNSVKGRAAVQAMEQGQWQPAENQQLPLEAFAERPNIYRLYEENIGPLTPLIAEALRAAEDDYPQAWIDEAFQIAVENNKRAWRYIDAILQRWQLEGRHERKDRQNPEEDRRRYVEGEFSDFIEH